MMRFKLLAGWHAQQDFDQEPNENGRYPSRTYVAGETVENEMDLVEMFGAAKFQRLDDAEPTRKPAFKRAQMVAPGGQVSEGHPMTSTAPDGRPMAGPADEQTIEDVETTGLEDDEEGQAVRQEKEKDRQEAGANRGVRTPRTPARRTPTKVTGSKKKGGKTAEK